MSGAQANDFLTWVGIIAATGVGAVGWIFAGVANRRAKGANELAKQSNDIAEKAVAKADAANRIAQDANKLSEDANALVGRSLAEQTEDWYVYWRAEWNAASASVILKNRGRDVALDASVTISGEGIHKVERWPEGVPDNQDVVVLLAQVIDQRNQHEARSAESIESLRNSGIIYSPSAFSLILNLSVRWRTGEGFVGDQDLTLKVT